MTYAGANQKQRLGDGAAMPGGIGWGMAQQYEWGDQTPARMGDQVREWEARTQAGEVEGASGRGDGGIDSRAGTGGTRNEGQAAFPLSSSAPTHSPIVGDKFKTTFQ